MKEVKIFVDANGEIFLRDESGQEYLVEHYDDLTGGYESVSATPIAPPK